MLGFLFSLLLMSSGSVLAAPVVASCNGVGGVVQEVIFLEHEDCSLAADLSGVFNQMAQSLKTTTKVNLVIGGPSDNASFDNGSIVQVPYRLVFYGQYGKTYETSLSSLYVSAAHEYGHAIFQEGLRHSLAEEYKELFDKLDSLSARKLAILKGESDVSFVGDSTLIYYSPEFRRLQSRMSAYSEFFADVLAVYHFNDRRAMVSALYHDGLNDFQFNYIKMRDFTESPDPSWEHLMADDHAKLALARAFVGQNLWPQTVVEAENYSDWIMFSILRVLALDLEAEESLEWEAINKNLIRELATIPKQK